MIPTLLTTTTGRLAAVGACIAAVLLGLAVRRAARALRSITLRKPSDASRATLAYYVAGLVSVTVSLDTSWRFFGEILHIVSTERIIMFSGVEVSLVACAIGMRANVRRTGPDGKAGSPGAPRMIAWLLCGFAGYAAVVMAGPFAGLARICLGPVLAMVMLHLALGIEIHNRGSHRTGTWARLFAELRERALSRFGLGDDSRDAKTRTRERAARRAARLALTKNAPLRGWRLARALRASDAAHDPDTRSRMLADLAVQRHADDLANLEQQSPWTADAPGKPRRPATQPSEPALASPALPAGNNQEPRHAKPADVIDFAAPTERPEWLTEDMSVKDAIFGYLDRHNDATGAWLTNWARNWFDNVNKDYGRNVRRQWLLDRAEDNRATAAGEQ